MILKNRITSYYWIFISFKNPVITSKTISKVEESKKTEVVCKDAWIVEESKNIDSVRKDSSIVKESKNTKSCYGRAVKGGCCCTT